MLPYSYPSSFTIEEKAKLNLYLDTNLILEDLDSIKEKQNKLEKELNQFDRIEERLREQIYFAQELIRGVQYICKTETKVSDIKRAIKLLIEDSYFEL